MRFFHKFRTLNYNFFALVNGILLYSKRKKSFTKVIEYLEKYSYVLSNVSIAESSEKYSDKIWQLWLQGEENMPPIVRKCTETVKKYYGDRVVLLNKETIKDYIQLPDYIEEKYKKGIIGHAHYSDIVRFSLLAKYGGCWVDSTIYLTGEIPQDIFESKFFSFKSIESENLKFINTIEQFKLFSNFKNKIISIESPYFWAGKPKSVLINAILQFLLEYWKHENKVIDYLMIDKMFILAVLSNEDCKKEFMDMPTYYLDNLLLLKATFFEKYNEEIYKNITDITPVHKLSYKNLHLNPYKDSLLNHLLDN